MKEKLSKFNFARGLFKPLTDELDKFNKASKFFERFQKNPLGDGLAVKRDTVRNKIDELTKGTKFQTDFGMQDAFKGFRKGFDSEIVKATESAAEWSNTVAEMVYVMQQDVDKDLKKSLIALQNHFSERINITANALKIEESLIGAKTRNTIEDEIAGLRELQAAKKSNYQTQLKDLTNFYGGQLDGVKNNREATAEITVERNNKLRDLNTEYRTGEINTQKQIADAEKKILDTRRDALISFKNLAIRESQSILSNLDFSFNRTLDFGNAVNSLNSYRDNVARIYSDIGRNISEQFALQLSDTKLTAEQRTNIFQEMYSEQLQGAQNFSRAFMQIDDAMFKQSEDNLTRQTATFTNQLKTRIDGFRNLQSSIFEFSTSFGDAFKNFGLANIDTTTAISAIKNLNEVLEGRMTIYQAQKSYLDKTHIGELANLGREIDLNKDLIALEKIRLATDKRREIADYETKITATMEARARALNAGKGQDGSVDANTSKIVRNYELIHNGIVDALKKSRQELGELENTLPENLISPKITELKNTIAELQGVKNTLGLAQKGEQQSLFASSTEGLKQLYESINIGQKNSIINQIAENGLWRERVDVITQTKVLQAQLADFSNFEKLSIEIGQLQQINALYAAQRQRIIEANTSFSDRINLLKAEMPSAATQLQDTFFNSIEGISNVFTNAVSQWDGTFKGLFKSVASGFADLAKSIIAEMVKMLVYRAIFKLIGSFAGGGTGIPSAEGLSSAATGLNGILSGIPGNATGGLISGKGTGTSDSILARLSNGEYINPADSVKYYGTGIFDALRNKLLPKDFMSNLQIPQFAGGGFVGGSNLSGNSAALMRSNNNYSSVNNNQRTYQINVQMPANGSGNQQSARQMGQQIINQLRKLEGQNI